MAWAGKRVLAVVPARGGSKGIPRKNLARVGGISLIAHAARVAAELAWVDRAVISTDDEEMAAEGEKHGLGAPFRRPAELASDSASGIDAWAHAWSASEQHYGERFELGVLLQPTTPLRRPADCERVLRTLVEGGFDTAAALSRIPGDVTPERAMLLQPDGTLDFYLASGAAHANRQSIPAYYYRNGVCYAATRAAVVDERRALGRRAAGVLVEGPVVSIDEPIQLELAELLWQRGAARRS